jgi:hypothetical protein
MLGTVLIVILILACWEHCRGGHTVKTGAMFRRVA